MPPSQPPSEPEPDRKRVRFDSGAGIVTSLLPCPAGAPLAETKRPPLPARHVVELRFVHSSADISEGGAAGTHALPLTAKPAFLHQIVPDELVHGCQHACIAVYIHLPSLTHWVDSHVEPYPPRAEVDDTAPTNVPALLSPFVKAGLTLSRSQFLEAIAPPYEMPVSNRVMTYSSNGEAFAVYKEKLFELNTNAALVKRDAFHDFHRRMAFFMFIHIDGASFIDDDDPRWEVFVTVALRDDKPAAFVGYATTYPFAVMQRKTGDGIAFVDRIRISQVAILPICQRRGHGTHLLDAIYEDAYKRSAIEITVEDPSRSFRILRDVTDLQWAYRKQVLPYSKAIDVADEAKHRTDMREKILVTPSQARRCLEVHQLRFVERDDADAYKKYRLWVKRRLLKETINEMGQFDPTERKEKLAQFYEEYENEYSIAARRIDTWRTNSTP